jgi:hypothetical protein
MSVEAVNWAYEQDIPGTQKWVLVTLAHHAASDPDEWWAWPSIQRLVRRTGESDKTVRRALDQLEANGFIYRERQRNADGSMGQYRYRLERMRLPLGALAVVVTAGEKPSKKHGPVNVTSGEKSPRKHGQVRMTGGEHPSGKSPHNHGPVKMTSRNPTGHFDQATTGQNDRSIEKDPLLKNHKNIVGLPRHDSPQVKSFEAIWKAWPTLGRQRSTSRAKCFEVFVKICEQRSPTEIEHAVSKFLKEADPKFVPGLHRWLRDGKFEHFIEKRDLFAAPEKPVIDWPKILAAWARDGFWPSGIGEPPTDPRYQGPTDLVATLIADWPDNHPTKREARRVIDARRRA